MRPSRSSVTVGACIGFAMAVASQARASEPSSPPKPRVGRGFMFGVGLGPSQMRFSGAEDLALVIGGPTETITLPHGAGR